VVRKLRRTGAEVIVYDPEGTENARLAAPNVSYAATLADAVSGADLLCVLTEWEEFRNADPHALAALARGHRVIDGRNCLDSRLWSEAGWEYRAMGR
jgi:UDPglucose 6-dehydrogenase